MAKPIEPTPVLKGEDAEIVLREIESASHNTKKEEFLKECKNIFLSTQR